MKKYQLGEFEEIVLLTVAVLFDDAYGVSIRKEIEQKMNRKVSVSALQTALRRMESKGFLNSRFGEATAVRGGKRKRLFLVTPFGKEALEHAKDTRIKLWESIPSIAFDFGK
ncbi:MAG: PadR family transcriptional regulator [Reichenbachiella sp.]|uniref:PadR family transcriptional regulator n=1 Tax=Reichenbachiella sp. TaxID=2184521 RepID=UPI003298B4EB